MSEPHKIFYKGNEHDFVIFTEDPEAIKKYKAGDKTVPLSDIVSVYKVFINRTGGVEGVLDEASKSELDAEFGKSHVDEVIQIILDQGEDKKTARFDTQTTPGGYT